MLDVSDGIRTHVQLHEMEGVPQNIDTSGASIASFGESRCDGVFNLLHDLLVGLFGG